MLDDYLTYISNSKEDDAKEKLSTGDTVLCLGKNSRHRGMIGKITEIGFCVIVEYPNTHLVGNHPATILRKIYPNSFDEELFIL